jgi:WS/DGAT/MGAT family acyltransferase
MSALDASFLYAEVPRAPLHVGSLSIFEGAPFFDERGAFRLDDVCRRVEERLPLFPKFRRRPQFLPLQFARPFWVDDEAFDIRNHVKLMVLPSPGSREELDALCGQLQMRLLDREHPLWELWFIGGLDDGNVALVEKIHHAMIDGVSGVEVGAALLDLEPVAAARAPDDWVPAAPPSTLRLLLDGVREDVVQPVEALRHLSGQLLSPAKVAELVTAVPDLARAALSRSFDPINLRHPVGPTRTLPSVTVPLAPLQDVAHGLGATINDVALAAVGGGVRALMEHRGDAFEAAELHVLVPVSLRREADQLALGNQVATFLAKVPVGDAQATTRLLRVRDAMAKIKADHQANGSELLVESLDLLPSSLLAATTRLIHHQPLVDVVVTNIPGPPCPLYFMGAEMLESIPIVPLGGNLAIGVAILSYNGRLTFGVHADPDACPGLSHFVDGLRGDLDAILTDAETARGAARETASGAARKVEHHR